MICGKNGKDNGVLVSLRDALYRLDRESVEGVLCSLPPGEAAEMARQYVKNHLGALTPADRICYFTGVKGWEEAPGGQLGARRKYCTRETKYESALYVFKPTASGYEGILEISFSPLIILSFSGSSLEDLYKKIGHEIKRRRLYNGT